MPYHRYKTHYGEPVPGCVPASWLHAYARTESTDRIGTVQMIESAGFSFAMVIRFALGHTANEGQVSALVTDQFPGWCALAALRHLVNAGSSAHVFLLSAPERPRSHFLQDLLTSLEVRGVQAAALDATSVEQFTATVDHSHNVLCGVASLAPQQCSLPLEQVTGLLNESPVPAHSVLAPLGVDPVTGASETWALFSSSTLSLGLPLAGLEKGSDFVGRHYLADLQWSRRIYRELGYEGQPLFREQPVIKLEAVPGE